jgi:hypothetical protein
VQQRAEIEENYEGEDLAPTAAVVAAAADQVDAAEEAGDTTFAASHIPEIETGDTDEGWDSSEVS